MIVFAGRRRDEKALDPALKNTFSASDPVSVEQLVLPAAHTIDAGSQALDFLAEITIHKHFEKRHQLMALQAIMYGHQPTQIKPWC